MRRHPGPLLILAALGALGGALSGQTPRPPAEVVRDIRDAAIAFLDALTQEQRDKAVFPFDDEAQKRRWSNLPVGAFERGGIRMGDLSAEQRDLVWSIVAATLSPRGYQQVRDTVNAEEVLANGQRRSPFPFGRDGYFVSFVGEPSAEAPWMWQFGGHHLALNATVVGDRVTLAPSITGGQPADFEFEGRKVRLLASEEAAAHRFLNALSDEQRSAAIQGEKYVDWAFGPNAESIEPKPEGLRADTLDESQRKLLLALITERVGILNAVHAGLAMERIERDLDRTWFAWFGPTEADAAITFRIQSPAAIVEYAPQRLGGNPRDHLHAMYREPGNDYGVRFLATDERDR